MKQSPWITPPAFRGGAGLENCVTENSGALNQDTSVKANASFRWAPRTQLRHMFGSKVYSTYLYVLPLLPSAIACTVLCVSRVTAKAFGFRLCSTEGCSSSNCESFITIDGACPAGEVYKLPNANAASWVRAAMSATRLTVVWRYPPPVIADLAAAAAIWLADSTAAPAADSWFAQPLKVNPCSEAFTRLHTVRPPPTARNASPVAES